MFLQFQFAERPETVLETLREDSRIAMIPDNELRPVVQRRSGSRGNRRVGCAPRWRGVGPASRCLRGHSVSWLNSLQLSNQFCGGAGATRDRVTNPRQYDSGFHMSKHPSIDVFGYRGKSGTPLSMCSDTVASQGPLYRCVWRVHLVESVGVRRNDSPGCSSTAGATDVSVGMTEPTGRPACTRRQTSTQPHPLQTNEVAGMAYPCI